MHIVEEIDKFWHAAAHGLSSESQISNLVKAANFYDRRG